MRLQITLTFEPGESSDFALVRWALAQVVRMHAEAPQAVQISVRGVEEDPHEL